MTPAVSVSLGGRTPRPAGETRLRNVKTARSAPPVCSRIIVLTLARRASRL